MFKVLWNCLSRQSDKWIGEWNETSLVRRHLRYSRVDQLLRRAGERTLKFLLDITASIVLLTTLAWIFVTLYPSPLGTELIAEESNLLTYFATLWTIQATLAALVYPIVISFVAVLLRKRATATLGLRIYSLDAAVVPAGTSSIALVGWMGLQYLAMPFSAAEWIAAAMVGNATWFIFNTLLTSHFLYRTIRFLNDEDRLEVFKRFAVHVALPRDLRAYLMGIILQSAQDHKLLPGPKYLREETGPQVLLYPMSRGSVCVSLKLNRELVVTDIRLRLLGWGISIWLRRARQEKPGPSIAGLGPEYPLLQLAVYPGQTVEGDATICRVIGSTKPNLLARYLIRSSIVLGPQPAKDVSYSTFDILEEIAAEALELVEQSRYEAAFGMLKTLAELHSVLVRSSAFINDQGAQDNAALLPDPYGLASRRIHERWLDSYDELAQQAVSTLPSSGKPFQHHCFLAEHLVVSLRHEHPDILIYLLHIPGYLVYRLGSWWSSRIEERGVVRHDHVHGAELPLPLGRVYEEAVESFIGYWERLDLWESTDERSESKKTWATQTRRGRFAVAHLDRALQMLLEAVARGDVTASLWLADSVIKWWNSRRYRFGELDPYNYENPSANAAILTTDWSAIRSSLHMPEGDEADIAEDVVATALHRYWSDIRLVAALVLLSWLPGDAPEDALSLKIAIALLTGEALKEGGDTESAPIDAQHVFLHLLRMQLVDDRYTSMLDRVVRKAREVRRSRMVSGRIYGSFGADDLQSLISAQALLLASMIHYRTRFPTIAEFERIWSEDLRKSERAERFVRQLQVSLGEDNYKSKRSCAEVMRRALGSSGTLNSTEDRIRRAATRLGDRIVATRNRVIGAASISQTRLDELGRGLSEYLLGNKNEVFPFVLSPTLRTDAAAANRRSVTFSGVRKAPYTDPLLEPDASLDISSYREIVASRIGQSVILDYVGATGVTALRADSESNFLADIEAVAKNLRTQGLTPLLLLPRYNVPECGRAWRYLRRKRSGEEDIPVKLREADDARGVTSFFHGVPAYQAPISSSCFVVAREDFAVLEYLPQTEASCLSVTAAPKTNDTIDLRFEWIFSVART